MNPIRAKASPSLEEIDAQRKKIDELYREAERLGKQIEAQYDPLIPFGMTDPEAQGRDFPVLFCRRGPLDEVASAAHGANLSALERQIDQGPTPASKPLAGWRATGEVQVERVVAETKNVVAVLPGEGPLAHEAVVVGAHYDHLGYGGPGSLAPGEKAIHNGADDNASGTAALLEIARSLKARPEPLKRSVVFVAFSAEESGLLGSNYYAEHPLVPMADTVAMLNLDMVGRLRDEKLTVFGTSTGDTFAKLIDDLNREHGLDINRIPGGLGPSDQVSFYVRQVPVLHFFTGTHGDYHRPSDDVHTLNIAGLRRVAELVTATAAALADAPERPKYTPVSMPRMASGGGKRPFFGSVPDFGQNVPGYAISGVSPGGPAEKGGLRGGDVIVQLGDAKIANLDDFDAALRKHQGGERVKVVVRRGQEELTLEVTLDPPR